MSIDAEYQAAWRERQIAAGRKPRTFYLQPDTLALIAQQARQRGINQHQALDQLLKDQLCKAT